MEVTLELIIGIAFFLVGARFVYIGKMDVEFGITNGQSGSRTKFTSSQTKSLEGTSARLAGALISIFGILLYVFMEKGDVLFFHSRLFHAAGRNLSEETKFSLVFTYHEAGNRPITGTRSSRFPSVMV